MSGESLMQWILLVPLLAALGILFTGSRPNLREAVSLAAGGLVFALVVLLAIGLSWEQPTSLVLAEPFPGLSLVFRPEPLGILFTLIASFLWPAAISAHMTAAGMPKTSDNFVTLIDSI